MPYIIFIFSLITPFYALIFSLIESLKKNSRWLPLISIALAFATISYSLVPQINYDLYRHYYHIESLTGKDLSNILKQARPGYILFDSYAWLINYLKLPKNLFPASIVFIGYLLKFSIYNDIKIKYLKNSSQIFILLTFLSFWLTINFFALSSGIRFGISNIIIIYISYLLAYKNKLTTFILGSVFAFFIHPFALAPAVLILVAKIFSHWSKHGRILILLGITLMFSTKLVTFGVNYIESVLSSFSFFSGGYFDESGQFGGGYVAQKNFNGYIVTVILPRLPFFLALIYLLLKKSQINNTLYLALCLITVYIGLFFSFYTLHARMIAVFLHLFSIYIIFENINSPRSFSNRLALIAFVGVMIVYSLVNVYVGLPLLITAKENFYKPLFFILFNI